MLLRGAGVQDLRPLRGRASGPILDPDTAMPHARNPAKEIKRTVCTTLLTSPAPSEMTCSSLVDRYYTTHRPHRNCRRPQETGVCRPRLHSAELASRRVNAQSWPPSARRPLTVPTGDPHDAGGSRSLSPGFDLEPGHQAIGRGRAPSGDRSEPIQDSVGADRGLLLTASSV